MGYQILNLCCLVGLFTVMLNIVALGKNFYPLLKVIGSVLVSFTALRYITLMMYGGSAGYSLLSTLRYFYLGSSIGITMLTVSAIWYVIPCYREKINYPYFLACFIPWILFYVYIIMKQPTEIVQGSRYGYQLILIGKFPFYLSVAQGSFVVVILALCSIGIISYKHLQIRTQLFLIILAQLLLTLDGLNYIKEDRIIFPPFTITESFALLTTYYAFSKTVRVIHALKNQ